MRRRAFLCVCPLALTGASSATFGQMVLQKPSPGGVPNHSGAEGCGSHQVERRPGPRPLLSKSDIAEIDQNIEVEKKYLTECFDLAPRFSFFDDGDTPEALALPSAAGTQVLIGVGLLRHVMKQGPMYGVVSTIGILAHEWAHAFQYESGLQEQRNLWETHADFMAGWYLGTKHATGRTLVPDHFGRFLYEKGDRKGFFDPDAHGSPQQRVSAMHKGFDVGIANYKKLKYADSRRAAGMGYALLAGALKR
jgi:hypothetical protein